MRRVETDTAYIYVVGEKEEPDGPVKIGFTNRRLTKSGRANLGAGNWRTLGLVASIQVPRAEVKWREWLTHQNLRTIRGCHVRGEWFQVRDVQTQFGEWKSFLDRAYRGDLPGCEPWRLGVDECHLASMSRLTTGMPRQFNATCSCGKTVTGEKGKALESVQELFATEHLNLSKSDCRVKDLRKRPPMGTQK